MRWDVTSSLKDAVKGRKYRNMVEMRPVIKDQLLNMGQSQDFSSWDDQIDWV